MPYCEIDGNSMFYNDSESFNKNIPPKLFVHGLGGSGEYWDLLRDHQAMKGYRLITIDLIGFGNSDKPKKFSFAQQEQAHLLKKLLDKLEIEIVDYIGHSNGGALGVHFTSLFPERIRRLVLVDTTLSSDYVATIFQRIRRLGERKFRFLFPLLKFRAKKMASDFFVDPNNQYIPLVTSALKKAPHFAFYRTMISQYNLLEGDILLKNFLDLDIQKYYIYGTADRVAKMVEERFPKDDWIIPIEDSGHCPMLEKLEEFGNVLGKILNHQ